MKLLLLSNMYPSAKAPAFGTFVKVSHDALTDAGFSVDRVVIDEKPQKKHQKLLTYFRFYRQALFALLFKRYDYVYAHYVSHVAFPLVIARALGRPIRLVAHVHGGDVKQLSGTSSAFFSIKQYFASKVMRMADKIVSPSHSYAKFVSDVYQLPLEKFSIYPSGGINEKRFFIDNTIPRRADVIGYAGRLIPSKNVDVIIRAISETQQHLEIIGTGTEEARLKSLVNELNVQDRVSFHAPKSHDELADWYRSIDCLVYPSSSESLGLVPLEAIACGADTILSDIPAFQELQIAKLRVNLLSEISHSALSDALRARQLDLPSPAQRQHNSEQTLQIYASEVVNKHLLQLFK